MIISLVHCKGNHIIRVTDIPGILHVEAADAGHVGVGADHAVGYFHGHTDSPFAARAGANDFQKPYLILFRDGDGFTLNLSLSEVSLSGAMSGPPIYW
jgi:hypothetical protein